MKFKVFSLCFLVLTFNLILGNDIFFSEYIEGSSNNKALEIYNGTESPIDLINYRIAQSSNGGGWEYYHEWSSSTILQANDVWVITTDAADAVLKAVADEILAYPSVVHFNGNDARGLEVTSDGGTNWTLIDVIGVPDQDVKWAVAGVADATAEYTLVRKPTVLSGNTDWAASAGTNANDSEWTVCDQNTFGFLGAHVAGSSENIPPFAKAGEDKVVGYESIVTLDGSNSSDPDGVIVSYLWSQFSGTSVTLANPDQSIASFTAPGSDAVLVFTLTVTDDSSATAIDTVKITVVDASPSAIFISEYVEGSSNNKYIEIYNGSDISIDLNTEGYELKKVTNGNNDFSVSFSDWGSAGNISSGGAIVLAHQDHAIFSNPDIVVTGTFSVISFNGNDAVALFRKGLLADVVGEPDNSSDIIKDMTLRRKNTILTGNSVFDIGEWDQFEKDNIEGLGTHSANPDAPSITNVALSQDFITSSMEIEISAVITPVVGSISTVTIKYGAGDNLVNSFDCWLENPTTNLWLGYFPSQPGNNKISYKIVATDDSGNSAESQVSSFLVASQQTTDISYIHENIETLTGSIVTIRGIMTIGAGVLRDDRTSAYIQDVSGRGLNLYHSQLFTEMNRGDEILAVGYVKKYYSTIEVEDFIYERKSTDNTLPATQTISITEANSGEWEGTLVRFDGKITEIVVVGAGNKITVSDENSNTTAVMIWGTTGIDINNYSVDDLCWFRGVESKYSDVAQLLVGYSEDIGYSAAIDERPVLSAVFKLNPAYPNPFNPSTNIHWQLDKSCDYELAAFNILGQKVDVISGGFGLAGSYTKIWNASDFSTGVYFIQLISENRKLTQKVILLK